MEFYFENKETIDRLLSVLMEKPSKKEYILEIEEDKIAIVGKRIKDTTDEYKMLYSIDLETEQLLYLK